MSIRRRTLLKGTLASSAAALAAGTGLLSPQAVLAAWPNAGFEAKDVNGAMSGLLGTTSTADSGDIDIKAPDIAENGAVVPVTVSTSMGNVESISIFAAENNLPLTSNWILGATTLPYVSTRLKMAKTSDLIAVVKAGGNLYSARKEVKVTIGGCGG